MKLQTAAIAALSLMSVASTDAKETAMTGSRPMLNYEDVRAVAPALEAYTKNRLLGDVWKRPGLALRDRSIVTLSALIARNQTIELVSIGVGGALAVTGAALLAVGLSKNKKAAGAAARLQLSPTWARTGAGLILRGDF